jgi:hypothetical protein
VEWRWWWWWWVGSMVALALAWVRGQHTESDKGRKIRERRKENEKRREKRKEEVRRMKE